MKENNIGEKIFYVKVIHSLDYEELKIKRSKRIEIGNIILSKLDQVRRIYLDMKPFI